MRAVRDASISWRHQVLIAQFLCFQIKPSRLRSTSMWRCHAIFLGRNCGMTSIVIRVRLGMEDSLHRQREVGPAGHIVDILLSASLRRCIETRGPGLRQVEAPAHQRHDMPPARVARAVALEALDARIPIAVYGVEFLAPHRNFKVFEAAIPGNLFLDSHVERSYID